MRTFTLLLVAGFLGVAALTGFLRGRADEKTKPDPITALVTQLGDDRFDTREAASKALEALGEKALPALIDAAAQSADPEVRRRARRLVFLLLPTSRKSKTLGFELVGIVAGGFDMGSPIPERNRRLDESTHRVQISRPFFLGAHEVTQDQYQRVMKANPSWFSPKGSGKDKVAALATDAFPVENVSWFDAVLFCNQLSMLDGLAPYYKVADVKRVGGVIKSASVSIVGGSGYRLPTEAEWEYSCRAGSNTAYHFGADTRAGQANLKSILVASGYGMAPKWPDLGRTTKVGSYPANRWGLYDMHGNVAEWCWDWYDKDYYDKSPAKDPRGPRTGTHRVHRGGSWLVTEGSGRSASRFPYAPDSRNYDIGFRVARNP